MIETVSPEKRLASLLDQQANQKRHVKLKTCADVYDYWRHCKRSYKKAPKDGVEFQIDYIDTGLALSDKQLAHAPIALALHGAPGSYHDFALLIHHLSQQQVRVIAPNFPEYVATVKTKVLFRHSADEKAAYLRDFLKAIQINKIDLLVSHSSAIFPTLLILLNTNNRAIRAARQQEATTQHHQGEPETESEAETEIEAETEAGGNGADEASNRQPSSIDSTTNVYDNYAGDAHEGGNAEDTSCRRADANGKQLGAKSRRRHRQSDVEISDADFQDVDSTLDGRDAALADDHALERSQQQLDTDELSDSHQQQQHAASTDTSLDAHSSEIEIVSVTQMANELFKTGDKRANKLLELDAREKVQSRAVPATRPAKDGGSRKRFGRRKHKAERVTSRQLSDDNDGAKENRKRSKGSADSKRRRSSADVIVEFDQPIEIKAVALFNPAGHRMPQSMKPTWFKCGSCRIYQHKLGRSLFRKLGPAFLTIIGVPVRVDNMDNVMLSATVMRNSRCHRVQRQLQQLSEMKLPTLLVFSENDKLIEKEIFYEMTEFMKLDPKNFDTFDDNGEVELTQSLIDDWIRVMVFKNGGHYAYSHYAKTVNNAVSELLNKVVKRSLPETESSTTPC